MTDAPRLSVVVPTLDEERALPALLEDLDALGAEVVVADGGSTDRTAAVARDAGARLVRSEAGRGRQLRAGAAAATGRWLFFLHADSRLDADAARALRDFVASADESDFAHFDFALEGSGWFHTVIELGQEVRQRCTGLVYGDQGLVVSRSLHDRAGGYPDWPIMEDVGMIRRLERLGRRVPLPATLATSARRYDEEGGLRRWLGNIGLMTLFLLGVEPRRLARWYRPRRVGEPDAPGPKRVVAVFAKAPTPGRVKTRLAADVGDAAAARIYRRLGRATVDALRGGPYRLVVFGDPPTGRSLETIGEWLDPRGIEVRPQAGGDLGARMAAALAEVLCEADEAVVVGTDIPGIDRDTILGAFRRLADHDVVIGPAVDGGYYLIGVSRPRPELFRAMPWSTPEVLQETLRRARDAQLRVALLQQKADVDTLADLPEAWHGARASEA